jgi:hypothetical protein
MTSSPGRATAAATVIGSGSARAERVRRACAAHRRRQLSLQNVRIEPAPDIVKRPSARGGGVAAPSPADNSSALRQAHAKNATAEQDDRARFRDGWRGAPIIETNDLAQVVDARRDRKRGIRNIQRREFVSVFDKAV